MNWPNHADYAEAIQSPDLCFGLPELQAGTIVTTPLGLPRAFSGNFASVYELQSDGKSCAIRCFIRQVTNQQDRYAVLERTLAKHQLDCLVPFKYIEKGLLVQDRWFPMVRMDWVEGLPLHRHVEGIVQSRERLAWLAADWRAMIAELRAARIGHGDLQHGNILVSREGRLQLVDYDGMYVPLFVEERSPELGHANYQHPRRTPEFYDERLDHFPSLLIYLSLRALAAEPELWAEFFNGDNLLATAVDLKCPQSSELWPRLLKSPDIDVRRMTVLLVDFLFRSPEEVPTLETVLKEQLGKVVLKDSLSFPVAGDAGQPDPAEAPEARVAEPGARVEALQPLVKPRPLSEFLGWCALGTALIGLAPFVRLPAAFVALTLGALAVLLSERNSWRVLASVGFAAVLTIVSLLTTMNFEVEARRQSSTKPFPTATVEIKAHHPMVEQVPGDSAVPLEEERIVEVEEPAVVGGEVRPTPFVQITNRRRIHASAINAVAVTSDGRYVVASGVDQSLVAWNLVEDTRIVMAERLTNPLISLVSLTNVAIVAGLESSHRMQWWSLDGEMPLKTSALDPDSVVPPAISPDGRLIATGGSDRRHVKVLFNTAPGSSREFGGLSSWAKFARFSSDNTTMVIVCLDDSLAIRGLAGAIAPSEMVFPDAEIVEAAFSRNNDHLAAVGARGAVRVWEVATGRVLVDHSLDSTHNVLAVLPAEPGGSRFVLGAGTRLVDMRVRDGHGALDELDTGTPISAIAAVRGGRTLVTAHSTGEVLVWDAADVRSGSSSRLAKP